MAETKKDQTPLVKAALALDGYFSDLERLGEKINQSELKTDFDFEQAQRLLNRFAECGQGISHEIIRLSTFLNEARARAEEVAKNVAARAEQLNSRHDARQKKTEEFRVLSEEVRALNEAMSQLRRPEGEVLSEEERAALAMRLAEFQNQLQPLIDKAQSLRSQAHDSKMKTLEQSADALSQALQAIRQKLGVLDLTSYLPQ